jgi:hypothetical protein
MTNKAKINNPNAIVVIYNYQDRFGDFNLSKNKNDIFNVNQTILNSVSLKSVTTQKTKSNPAGSFELRLAPIRNWVTAITPGSWCVILMSNSGLNDAAKYGDSQHGSSTVDEKSFKMMGRIESVRCVSNVNQSNGALETEYIVTGVDWGVIFSNKFYVDPLNRGEQEQNGIGMSARFGYGEYLLNAIGYDGTAFGADANTSATSLNKRADNDKKKVAVVNQDTYINNGSKTPVNTATAATTPVTSTPPPAKRKLPSAIDNVNFILQMWGESDKVTSKNGEQTGLLGKSEQIFTIPNDLVKYMGFVDVVGDPSGVVYDIVNQLGGKLIGLDTYEDKDYSSGIVDFSGLLGEHTIWQLISSNTNELINELIPEVRFINGKPNLTLYNRVRPFAVNTLEQIKKDTNKVGDSGVVTITGLDGKPVTRDDQFSHKQQVDPFISKFSNVRRKTIDPADIMMCSYGTNWRDRVNFVEVTIGRTLYGETYTSLIKLDSQFIDEASVARDGFLSMMVSTSYLPTNQDIADPMGVSTYKHALKEWHFNTHKMFNGTLSLVGQDQYIQVGDNILVDAKVLNKNHNINIEQNKNKNTTYMLAHVESISHQATVDGNGSRVFTTSINFVRGIITDVHGNVIVSAGAGAVDQDADLVDNTTARNLGVFSSSEPTDPDREREPNLKK